MKNKFNVLILDDNETIGENIKKRIFKANSSNYSFSGIEVIPHFLTIDISDLANSAKKINQFINSNNIDYLLLDRGFYHIIDPKLNSDYNHLDKKYLYTIKADLKNGIKIEKILEMIPQRDFKKIKGVIVYSYDASDDYIEPAQIKQLYVNLLPEKFNEKNIEIILTNSKVYKLSGLQLYIDQELPENKNMTVIGLKSDFKLYGLFMGEILYHRVISMVDRARKSTILTKRKLVVRNLIILFLSFTALTIGGNALYEILSEKVKSDYFLLFSSIVFALLIPLFILAVKPELLIDIDNE